MNFKQIKLLLKKIWPTSLLPIAFVKRYILQKATGYVIDGPFAKMQYVDNSIGSQYLPKLMGTYEKELHEVVEDMCKNNFSLIVNVGAAEGYYAVGFAFRTKSTIVAFEGDSCGQELIRGLAAKNNVEDRVTVYGWCDTITLQETLIGEPAPLVLVDVEGYEKELLDPLQVPTLCNSQILVEVHDYIDSEIATAVKSRFAETHDNIEIWSQDRTITDFPFLLPFFAHSLFKHYWMVAISEGRQERMRWLYLTPK